MTKSSPPVVIAGMHRSGTSLIASIVAASGLDVGDRLVPADVHNPKGYFEDTSFLEINRRMLVQACAENDGGHPDWGWTESQVLDTRQFATFQAEGRELIDQRAKHGGRWGFKDPRATLLLDFWHGLLEAKDPRYLLVYRLPWDVADSMQRLGAEVFLRNPNYALQIWSFYNKHLLDFYQRHRDRSILVNTNALLRRRDDFAQLLSSKLDIELDRAELERIFDAEMLSSLEPDDPLIGLTAATSPAAIDLLEKLDKDADLPATGHFAVPGVLRAPAAAAAAQPLIGVVIPCRDHGQFLIEAVASVERSIDLPYELVIVDDGSTEARTVEVLEILQQAGYRVLRGEKRGLSAARNLGIAATDAPFILPLDADNRLRPGFVKAAIERLEASDSSGAVYGDCFEFGQRRGRRVVGKFNLDKLLEANYIDACAVLRKSMWHDVSGYDEELPAWEDWELWIRVAKRGWNLEYLDQIAFDYRVRPDSLVTITRRGEVIQSILDHVVGKHPQLFHDHLVRLLGHALGTWALRSREQELAGRLGAREKELADAEESTKGFRSAAEAAAQRLEAMEKTELTLRLELEHARVERLELERELERAAWRVEHAQAAAGRFEDAAAHMQSMLVLQGTLHEAERRELQHLREAVTAERRHRGELEEGLAKIQRSRAFRWVRVWWNLVERLRSGSGKERGLGPSEGSHEVIPGATRTRVTSQPPVEDGAVGG